MRISNFDIERLKTYMSFIVQIAWKSIIKIFNNDKIFIIPSRISNIKVSRGQVIFEFKHLMKKLKVRDHRRYKKYVKTKRIKAHPAFKVVKGEIEQWERT